MFFKYLITQRDSATSVFASGKYQAGSERQEQKRNTYFECLEDWKYAVLPLDFLTFKIIAENKSIDSTLLQGRVTYFLPTILFQQMLGY